ncbi:MAG: FimV family protein, partial [Betaproteobacteria bacterium]
MRCAIALAFSLALSSPELHAAGLGRLNVQSALGQPLRAEVEVTSVSRDEAPTLSVRLASQSAFRQANLDFNPALAAMRFSLEKRGETSYIVRITSLQPVNEPYLDLLLELSWATGRLLR